jgi:hypothetical protein
MKANLNTCLQILVDQIGHPAFFMMNAHRFRADKATNTLSWRISNSRIQTVRVTYQTHLDLYELGFMTVSKSHISEIVIEHIGAGELHATIERMTGLRLSLTRVYAV